MWKLSTTIKGVQHRQQTVLGAPTLAKGRKTHPAKPSQGHHSRDADHARSHLHAGSSHVADGKSGRRLAMEMHARKHDGAPKPARHTAKAGPVHRWHIPSHVVRHKIKPAPHAEAHAMQPRESRSAARQPHRPDLPERITTHPGEILREEFLKPLGLSVNGLAAELRVPANRIGAIVKGERSVTADTALRLGRYFRTSPEFWLNLQTMHDLTRARREIGMLIELSIHPRR